jgi:Holliday junction resolvasome RuvABC endonuclease subunit
MTVFGVDWSLGATGIASWDGAEWDVATIKPSPEDSSRGAFLERVDAIAARIIAWCDPHEGDIFVMEGPAVHAKSAQLDRMFAGWWMTYRALREHHAEPWVLTPSELKKLATGNGGASKEDVLIQAIRRIPEAGVANNNEADAVWLGVAGSIIQRSSAVALPTTHLSTMKTFLT